MQKKARHIRNYHALRTERNYRKRLIVCMLGLIFISLIGIAGWQYKAREKASAYTYKPDKTVKIIFDTDMDTDVDDVGALAVLHSYVQEGRADLLAVVGSCRSGYASACMDAINTYYGLPNVPVGISHDCPSSGQSSYQRIIAETYENDVGSDDRAEYAVDVYRKTLAKAEDGSVVIAVVGALNNLYELFQSDADKYSNLDGIELVRQKVKLVIIMGGMFPESEAAGEYNIRLDDEAADYVSQNCPVSICWNGYEVGEAVQIGKRIEEMPEDSPARKAYELYFSAAGPDVNTRSSWDLVSVLYAVEGKGLYFDERRGHAMINGQDKKVNREMSEAYNGWIPDIKSKDAILILRVPPENIAEILENRMVLSEQQ